MANIITVKDMNLWYSNYHALKNISIDMPANKITALIGPSGCGKSTFLKTLNRMNDLVDGVKITGSIQYDNKEIFGDNIDVTELRRQIGMVFQKPNPFPMSIYDNIAYGPRTHGIKNKIALDEIVEESLKAAAIWDEVKDRLKKSALGLSGGQQQRLCIARALAVQPKILLMDEPTKGLDAHAKARVIEALKTLKEKGVTLVIVTHDVEFAAECADRCAMFFRGEITSCESPREFFEGNNFYTTAANRMTRGYYSGVVTVKDAVELAKRNGRKGQW